MKKHQAGDLRLRRVGILVLFSILLLDHREAEAARFEGMWHNTTFGSVGALLLDVQVTGARLSGEFDLGGFVFGETDPEPVVFDAPIDEKGVATAQVVGNATFGNLTFVVDTVAGTLMLDSPDVPGSRIQSMVVTGQFTPQGISGTYRIEFETPTPEGSRVEGIDFALGTIDAAPAALTAALRVTSIVLTDTQVEIRWTSAEGKNYRIESSLRPGIDEWTIAMDAVTGSAGESLATLPRGAGDSTRYFRVREIQ